MTIAELNESRHPKDRIEAVELANGHVVFYVYRLDEDGFEKQVAYVGLTESAANHAAFAKAILRVVEPEALAPEPEPAPELPTDRGVYRDRDGDLWIVFEDGEKPTYADGGDVSDPERYLPFSTIFLAKDNA